MKDISFREIEQIMLLLCQLQWSPDRGDTLQKLDAIKAQNPHLIQMIEALQVEEWEREYKIYLQQIDLSKERDEHLKTKFLQKVSRFHTDNQKRAVRQNRFLNFKALAAMWVTIFLGIGFVLYQSQLTQNKDHEDYEIVAKSLKPGQNSALLTLEDGRQYDLAELGSGLDFSQELAALPMLAEILKSYTQEITIEAPKGCEYKVVLSDGTRVFLNANSRLKYPAQFGANDRPVELIGEAYFEVSKDVNRPFVVQTPNNQIQVLGTSFNVEAYSSELPQKVTLVEGEVVVVDHLTGVGKSLIPGQQYFRSDEGKVKVETVVLEDELGWRSGKFVFNDMDIATCMRMLERWYDLDIYIHSSVNDLRIWGSLDRSATFDQVIEILTLVDNELKFKIHDRRVDIMK